MKTVFSNYMVIHVWAQQNQESGRNSGNSLSFSRDTLYSYATPIARIVEINGGRRVALITNVSYSITTNAKHMPNASALSQYQCFKVQHLGVTGGRSPHLNGKDQHVENLADYVERYTKELLKLARAKERMQWIIASLANIRREAMAYADAFEMSLDRDYFKTHFPDPTPEQLSEAKDKAAKASAAKAKKTRADNMAKEKQCAIDLEKWLKGETSDLPHNWYRECNMEQLEAFSVEAKKRWRAGSDGYFTNRIKGGQSVMLRIKGEMIQTSHNAEFPIKHGIKAFKTIAACRERAIDWVKNGHKIHLGHFQIDRIAEDGTVYAGCHTVPYVEIEMIAQQLNLI